MLDISVIVPTYNRRSSLLRTLSGLSRQTVSAARFEVVVISDGATDGTAEAVRALSTPYRLRFLEQENAGPSAARNHGAQVASNPLLVYLDDDIEPDPGLLAAHIGPHEADEQLVLIGPQAAPPGETPAAWIEWEHRMLERQYAHFRAGDWEVGPNNLYSGNFSLRREHLLAAGGFDEAFRRQEDVELGYRLAALGLRFAFEPTAVGWHRPDRSLQSWLAAPYLYGVRDVQMARDKGQEEAILLARKHYRSRSRVTRAVARLCIGRRVLEPGAVRALSATVSPLNALGLRRMALPVCSLLFNLRYLQGAANEMGGRRALWAAIRSQAASAQG